MEKKINANKYDISIKQLGEIAEAINLPKKIDEVNKGHYHVAFIKSTANTKELKFDHKVTIQCFGVKAFNLHKKRFGQLGKSNIVIFHDPTIGVTDSGDNKLKISYDEMKQIGTALDIEFNNNISKVDIVAKLEEVNADFTMELTLEETKSLFNL